MNKTLVLLLGVLLISSVSGQFLQNLLNLGYDQGEDFGEDSGEDRGEINGEWNYVVHSDNGEYVDSGEFDGYVEEQDHGEYRVQVNFSRYKLESEKGEDFQKVVVSDKGEYTHIGVREHGKHGKVSKDEVVPQIIKRLKQH